MKRTVNFLLAILLFLTAYAQDGTVPVKEWRSEQADPFIFYISGDGGLNNFSTSLCTSISKAGYRITALNAKTYFWDKQTPGQTAADIVTYLTSEFQRKPYSRVVLVGYSFGADVTPFVVNKLPDNIRHKLTAVVLLSPSASTDFEIHLSDMLGGNKKRSMDVIAEINRMGMQKTVTIFGNEEKEFSISSIKLKNYSNEILPGGHHFDGNPDEVAQIMMRYFK